MYVFGERLKEKEEQLTQMLGIDNSCVTRQERYGLGKTCPSCKRQASWL